ncbi:MAG: hypothetical protein ACK5NB_08350 [Flavobacteriaceae bacterium]
MTNKLLIIFSLCLLTTACKNTQDNTDIDATTNTQDLTEKDIAKLKYTDYILDDKTEKTVTDWAQYHQLQEVINNIKKGDLSYFNDNEKTITDLFKDLKQHTPETLKTDAITVRITAFETQFYKLGNLSVLSSTSKQQLQATIKDVLIAFSNLNLQMNKKMEADHYNSITRP